MTDLNERAQLIEHLHFIDRELERLYFSGKLPEKIRAQVWFFHGELKQHGLVERDWTAPAEVAA